MVPLRDEDVAGVAADLGLPGIFDVHVHFMPGPVQDKVWAYFDSAGPL
ncbi:MAG: amidohydrolase, partial [Propionibacteriales bacterium]|nr:amidohydrolase [Propionibacteriales bacterium]